MFTVRQVFPDREHFVVALKEFAIVNYSELGILKQIIEGLHEGTNSRSVTNGYMLYD